MYESRIRIFLSLFVVPALGMLVAAGCSTGHTSTAEKKQQKRVDRDKKRAVETSKKTAPEDGAMYFPTHSDQKVLKLERTAPKETRVGEEYPYNIKVTNVSDAPAHGIVVREYVDGNLQLVQKEGRSRLRQRKTRTVTKANVAGTSVTCSQARARPFT